MQDPNVRMARAHGLFRLIQKSEPVITHVARFETTVITQLFVSPYAMG